MRRTASFPSAGEERLRGRDSNNTLGGLIIMLDRGPYWADPWANLTLPGMPSGEVLAPGASRQVDIVVEAWTPGPRNLQLTVPYLDDNWDWPKERFIRTNVLWSGASPTERLP